MQYCKIFSLLLDYPNEALWQARDELIESVYTSHELTALQREQLINFMRCYFKMPLLDAQENYYQTFEMGSLTSLLLFEHVYGDSRDRGQAMTDLIAQYSAQGLALTTNQLPDYLPLFLEYLAVLSAQECQKWLGNIALILRLLALRLQKNGSHFAIVFNVLYQLSQQHLDDSTLQQRVAQECADNTNEAMDKVWQEAQVLFQGTGNHHYQSLQSTTDNTIYYVTINKD